MTVKDLIKNNDYDCIEYYVDDPTGESPFFAGLARSISGELHSLDGDSYDVDAEVVRYEFFEVKDTRYYSGDRGLMVVVKGEKYAE